MATDYRNQFTEGFHSVDIGQECPYLLTSNYSDAWMLGRYAATHGLSAPARASDLRKSRGHTWKLRDNVYCIDGTDIERIG